MSYLSQSTKPLLRCALLLPLPSIPLSYLFLPKYQMEEDAVCTQIPVEVLSQMMERNREMRLPLGLHSEGPMTYLFWEKVDREP